MFSLPLSLRLFGLALTLVHLPRVVPQITSSVNCTTASWANNAEGQDPCIVAVALRQACAGNTFNLAPLAPGKGYSGPPAGGSSPCICSTVTYATISACALCQNANFISWSQWIVNCSKPDINEEKFPVPIPQGITVPAWAYLNVSGTGTFDFNQASQIAVAHTFPDVNGTNVPDLAQTTTASSSSKSNTGAIAGGVVGGIVGLLFILLGGLLLCKKMRNRRERQYKSTVVAGLENQAEMQSMAYVTPTSMPMKLYDPSDPTTFPPTPGPNSDYSMIISPTSLSHNRNLSDNSSNPSASNVFSPTSASGMAILNSNPLPSPPRAHAGSTSPTQHGRNISAETGLTHTTGGPFSPNAAQTFGQGPYDTQGSGSHGRNLSGGSATGPGAPGYSGMPEV